MNAGVPSAGWQSDLVDAYAHIGRPKYGAPSDIVRFFNRLAIREAVLVLGPGIPDLYSLALAREQFGDHIRMMGIPFGETEEQRLELGEVQMRIGISGMRMMPSELAQNAALVERLGVAGLWLFAINPFESPDGSMKTVRVLLEWLERHPAGRVASPHFLRPYKLEDVVDDVGLFRTLLKHPRYHAILSRFGGAHSTQPYPHRDLRLWVEQIVELITWQRLLWGSEFPIFYQRSEQPENVRDWLIHLGVPVDETALSGFYAGNARRLFFSEPPPQAEQTQIPEWVQAQVDQDAAVYLFPPNPIYIPMQDHGVLLSDYLELAAYEPRLDYAGYIARLISAQAESIRQRGDNP